MSAIPGPILEHVSELDQFTLVYGWLDATRWALVQCGTAHDLARRGLDGSGARFCTLSFDLANLGYPTKHGTSTDSTAQCDRILAQAHARRTLLSNQVLGPVQYLFLLKERVPVHRHLPQTTLPTMADIGSPNLSG